MQKIFLKSAIGFFYHGAIGVNKGKIIAEPNVTNDRIIGVVALNGAILKNYLTNIITGVII